MNWRKSLCVAVLTGAVVTAAFGCSQVESTEIVETETAVSTQSSDTTVKQIPRNEAGENGNRPEPFSDNISGEMRVPPSGNFTGERPSAPVMDLAAAAAQLGITEEELSEALSETQQGLMALASVAEKLGLTEDALREALGFTDNMTMPPGGGEVPDVPLPVGIVPDVQ